MYSPIKCTYYIITVDLYTFAIGQYIFLWVQCVSMRCVCVCVCLSVCVPRSIVHVWGEKGEGGRGSNVS